MYDTAPIFPRGKKARIEIIPLIDVVFFLLATFVLFTLCLNRTGALSVILPQAGREPPDDTNLYLRAEAENLYVVHEGRFGPERTVSADALKGVIADYRSRVSPARAMIEGSSGTTFGTTVRLIDLVQGAGIRTTALNTSPYKE